MMTEYRQVIQIFDDYLELTIIEKGSEDITSDDIDEFLDGFLDTRSMYFFKQGSSLRTANYPDPVTQEKPFDMTDKTHQDAIEELKPILEKKVKDRYGNVSAETNAYWFHPTPRSVDDWAFLNATDSGLDPEEWVNLSPAEKNNHPAMRSARIEVSKMKSRITQYFDRVLPFMLRKTMHHPISSGIYSTTDGTPNLIRLDSNRNPVTLDSEEELQKFLSSTYYPPGDNSFPAAKHGGYRYMFWSPTTSGKNIKMAVIDVDNPAKVPLDEVILAVKQAARTFEKAGHPLIVMFTGNTFQIWIGPTPDNPFTDQRIVEDYITKQLFKFGATNRERAIANEQVHFDKQTLKATQQIRMFFSLHYPTPDSTKDFTGLAAVPVRISDLGKSFEPTIYAHPETVLANFDDYATLVADFFDTVEVGQDYDGPGELESDPIAVKVEGKHDNYVGLKPIAEQSKFNQVVPEKIASSVSDEEFVYASVLAKGVDAVLEYRAKGGFKFNGTILKHEKKVGNTLTVEPIRTILVTKSGIVIHSDYITRDIERFCETKGISELRLIGQIVKKSVDGDDADVDDIQSLLINSDNDSLASKRFHFILNYIESYEGEPVPVEKMEEEVVKINTNRVTPAPSFSFSKPVGRKLKNQYQHLRKNRIGNRMIVMGKEKYYVSAKRTVNVVVMGVSKESAAYKKDSDEIGTVYIGFLKRDRNKGAEYYFAGRASLALSQKERIRLKELVYGAKTETVSDDGEAVIRYDNVVPINLREEDFTDQILLTEPKIVVEIEYDDVSGVMSETMGFNYVEINRMRRYRPILKKPKWITKLINSRVIGIREDLNPTRHSDVGVSQEELIVIKSTPNVKKIGVARTLANPANIYDFNEYYHARLHEPPNEINPYMMSSKSYRKFKRMAKREDVVGFVKGKHIRYDTNKGWAQFGNNEELINSDFTFVSISQPFRLRGIDVINATHLCVEYGINWHLVIHEGKFWWIYCELENSDFQLRRDNVIAGAKDEKIKSVLSDLVSAVETAFPLKDEVVEVSGIPGFNFQIEAIEMMEAKKNPAFFGVSQQLNRPDSMYSTIIDAKELPEPLPKWTKYGVVDVNYVGGKKVYPPLFKKISQFSPTPEFERAYKRFDDANKGVGDPNDKGWKLFVDEKSLVKNSDTPYYNITNLPFQMQNVKDDSRGYGQDGTRVVTMDSSLKDIRDFNDQLNLHKLTNVEQEKEDLKVVHSLANRVPGDPNSESQTYWNTDSTYELQMRVEDAQTKDSMKDVPFAHFPNEIPNPPVKAKEWEELVSKYVEAYDEWDREEEAKEPWERYSVGMFPSWAQPMLEKERLLHSATSTYSLTEEEEQTINSTFGVESSGDLLESTLGDLYEEVEEDDEIEEFDPYDTSDGE